MPPKGWRKNAEGKFPQNPKDMELVSIDEILFPKSTISKLAKNITASDNNDANMIISKDSLLALQRSATVFVSHLMFHARQVAKDADRKNVSAQDILQGLEKADLSGFIPEVKQKLTTFEHGLETKKKQKAEQKAAVGDEGPAAKKLKDNEKQLVIPTEGSKAGEDGDDDLNVAEDTEEEGAVEDVDNEDDGVEDAPNKNPIELLGQEEEELEGAKEDAADTIDASSNEEDDDEDDK